MLIEVHFSRVFQTHIASHLIQKIGNRVYNQSFLQIIYMY
jgi:hypothetical protein